LTGRKTGSGCCSSTPCASRNFSERIEKLRADITAAAYLQISALVPDEGLARWAALLAPAVAIEAVERIHAVEPA
jgi:hypothetical protein